VYSVDVHPAPFGKTEAKLSMNDDGQITDAEAKIDEEVPEILNALGNVINSVKPATGGKNAVSDLSTTFAPGLPSKIPDATLGSPISIDIHPIEGL